MSALYLCSRINCPAVRIHGQNASYHHTTTQRGFNTPLTSIFASSLFGMGRNGHPDGQPTFFGSVQRRFMSWPDHRPTCATPTCCDWRHRGQSPAVLHARVPRARCDKWGVKKISVPWASDGGGLTLLFEALVRALVSAMPGNAVARLVGEHDTKLWRVIGSTACRQAPDGPFGLRGCLPPLQKSTQLGTTRAARNLAYQVLRTKSTNWANLHAAAPTPTTHLRLEPIIQREACV